MHLHFQNFLYICCDLFSHPLNINKTFKFYQTGMYKVLPTEPLHDVKEHISNIITEIVAHLTSEEKKLCQDTLSLDSGTRDQLRGSDYREILIVLPKQLRGELTRTKKHTQIELGICPCSAQCVSAVTSMVTKQLNVFKAYKCEQTKGFFPYQWLDCLDKWEETSLLPHSARARQSR